MNSTNQKQFHLLDPASSFISDDQSLIEATVLSKERMLALRIAPEVVILKDTNRAQEIILALRHFPQHIEKMLGTLHFDFQAGSESELFIPEKDWKRRSEYRRWFLAMSSLEVMPFFVKDKDARLYMLAGDFMAKGNADITKEEREGGTYKYVIRGGIIPRLCQRLAASCRHFMLYCHGSGFDPKDAVLSMLADYTLPVHYVDIYKEYQKEIKRYGQFIQTNSWPYRFVAA